MKNVLKYILFLIVPICSLWSCADEDEPEKFRVKQTLVSMKHTNWEYFVLPSFLGDNLSGSINWGDGKQEDLQNEASHSYTEAKEYTVTVELKGANKVAWKDLVGLTEIDLSAF